MEGKAHVTRYAQTPLGHLRVFASQDIHQLDTSALVRMLKSLGYSMLRLLMALYISKKCSEYMTSYKFNE